MDYQAELRQCGEQIFIYVDDTTMNMTLIVDIVGVGSKNQQEGNSYKINAVSSECICTKKKLMGLSMLFEVFTNEIDALLLLDDTQVGVSSTNIITEQVIDLIFLIR